MLPQIIQSNRNVNVFPAPRVSTFTCIAISLTTLAPALSGDHGPVSPANRSAKVLQQHPNGNLLAAVFQPPVNGNASNGNAGRSIAGSSEVRTAILAQGRLQPKGGILKLSGLPGDEVEKIVPQVGELVSAGSKVAVLKSTKLRSAELEIAKLKREEAVQLHSAKRRELELAVKNAELSILASEQSVVQSKAQIEALKLGQKQLETLRGQLQVIHELREDSLTRAAVSRLELDSKQLEVDNFASNLDQQNLTANQIHDRSHLQLSQSKETLAAAKQLLEDHVAFLPLQSIDRQIELLELQYRENDIVAAKPGTVLRVMTEEGERISTLPVLEIADLTQMVCVTEVYEGDIPQVALGASATMHSSALIRPLTGKVVRIERVAGASQLRSLNPMARTDFRAIGVWIEIPLEQAAMAAERVHLQVEVSIVPQSPNRD